MNAWLTPMDADIDAAPHRCGKCANPYGLERTDCPNRPNPAPAVDGYFTNDEMAALMADWEKEL